MSGLKQGALEASLNRLHANLKRYVELARGSSSRFNLKNENLQTVQSIRRALDNLHGMSPRTQEFAGEERAQWEKEIRTVRDELQVEEQRLKTAQAMQNEGNRLNEDIDAFLSRVEETAEEINRRAQHKIDTTDWIKLALDKEVAQIDNLSRAVTGKIHELSGQMSVTLQQRYDLMVSIQGRLASISTKVRRLTGRGRDIERLADNRYEAKKLLEAQQAASVQCDGEIRLLEERMAALDCERFKPGQYGKLEERIHGFREKISNGDYARSSQDGPGIVADLKAFAEELEALIQAFHGAENDARAKLQAAQEELAAIDLEDLRRWSQKPGEIQQVLDDLKTSQKEIEVVSAKGKRASEFDGPMNRIGSAIDALRELVDLATTNHARYDARDDIRKAIRDALKNLKYDKPEYSLGRLPDGSVDDLSDLTIYAHNPANTANMRLNVDLQGKVSFEVFREDEAGNEQEVTMQDARTCHNAVLAFQEQLEDVGIHFSVTDWGKAKELPQAQEQGRITWDEADPGKQGKSGEVVESHEQHRQQERQKEQQRS